MRRHSICHSGVLQQAEGLNRETQQASTDGEALAVIQKPVLVPSIFGEHMLSGLGYDSWDCSSKAKSKDHTYEQHAIKCSFVQRTKYCMSW